MKLLFQQLVPSARKLFYHCPDLNNRRLGEVVILGSAGCDSAAVVIRGHLQDLSVQRHWGQSKC